MLRNIMKLTKLRLCALSLSPLLLSFLLLLSFFKLIKTLFKTDITVTITFTRNLSTFKRIFDLISLGYKVLISLLQSRNGASEQGEPRAH